MKPLCVTQRIDEFDLLAWQERLKHLKRLLKSSKIEGDVEKSWTAGDLIKGSTSGGWRRITVGAKHSIGAFTFAHCHAKNPFYPYLVGSPSQIIELYEELFEETVIDATSLDGSNPDPAVSILEENFDRLINDIVNSISAQSKDPDISKILSESLRLTSGAPFDFPQLSWKSGAEWHPLLKENAQKMLQTMMNPIIMVSQSKKSRTLKFHPFKTQMTGWKDPGPMEKMQSLQRFLKSRDPDPSDD